MLGISCYIHIHHCFHREGAQAFNNLSLWLVHALVMFVTDLYQVSVFVCWFVEPWKALFNQGVGDAWLGAWKNYCACDSSEQYEHSSNQPCFQTPWTNRYQGT